MTDPRLAWKLLTGPVVPARYRLEGPGSWTGARDEILSTCKKVVGQLKTRQIPASTHDCIEQILLRRMTSLILIIPLSSFLSVKMFRLSPSSCKQRVKRNVNLIFLQKLLRTFLIIFPSSCLSNILVCTLQMLCILSLDQLVQLHLQQSYALVNLF